MRQGGSRCAQALTGRDLSNDTPAPAWFPLPGSVGPGAGRPASKLWATFPYQRGVDVDALLGVDVR